MNTNNRAVASLEACDLEMSYGPLKVLDRISFGLQPGSITALVGANGAGKSTLISLLLGLAWPAQGEARVCGWPADSAKARIKRAFALQDSFFPYLLSPRDCLRFFESCYGPAESAAAGKLLLTPREMAARSLRDLSGGQRRKVLVAAALQVPVDVYILDEPTAMFDAESKRSFWRTIVALREQGKTIFFTSHNLDEVQRQADRILLLSRGRITQDGTLASVGEALKVSIVRFSSSCDENTIAALMNKWGTDFARMERRWQVMTRQPERLLAELFSHGVELHELSVERPSLEECLERTGFFTESL